MYLSLGIRGGQERVSDPRELAFQVVFEILDMHVGN